MEPGQTGGVSWSVWLCQQSTAWRRKVHAGNQKGAKERRSRAHGRCQRPFPGVRFCLQPSGIVPLSPVQRLFGAFDPEVQTDATAAAVVPVGRMASVYAPILAVAFGYHCACVHSRVQWAESLRGSELIGTAFNFGPNDCLIPLMRLTPAGFNAAKKMEKHRVSFHRIIFLIATPPFRPLLYKPAPF